MSDDEIQLTAQRSIQEYEDAVENLDPNFAELGRKSVAALDEFIEYWNKRPESPESNPTGEMAESDMRRYVERQLEWARSEKERILAQLPKENA